MLIRSTAYRLLEEVVLVASSLNDKKLHRENGSLIPNRRTFLGFIARRLGSPESHLHGGTETDSTEENNSTSPGPRCESHAGIGPSRRRDFDRFRRSQVVDEDPPS